MRSGGARLHVLQWRGYFSPRTLLYKKVNGRTSYNSYLWENRLIGSSINMLLGNSYVFRLQSRKNKLATISLRNDAVRCKFIPCTGALKRKHFSYSTLGQSLFKSADPIQSLYMLGKVRCSLYAAFSRRPTLPAYLQLKKIIFFFNRYCMNTTLGCLPIYTLASCGSGKQSLLSYLKQLQQPVRNVCIQADAYLQNKEFSYFYNALSCIKCDKLTKKQRICSAKLFTSLSYLANNVLLAKPLSSRKFNSDRAAQETFSLYKKTYASFLRLRIANVNALFTSL
eukprot:TRINITY_DN46_c0_g1_i2.p3 TRINITY_DN46_c0_g1~~TRINITY_DN46_c0_g1_i2.p3  ORF type:complete len:282 (-),score=-23.41 TRINITY_DN46_c0_g1_i2:3275-4120(-)